MKVPQLARYNGTVAQAYKFVKNNIAIFPINPFELIKKFNWGLITYKEMAKNNNCTIDDICECLGTDGYSIYNGNNYTIAYNNTIQSKGRINFTLAHEIGHIILKHHKDFEVTEILKNNFSKEEYKILENEASCFARNILSPAPLSLKISSIFRYFKLTDIFDITPSARRTRLSLLKQDLNYLSTEEILNMQEVYDYYLKCTNCKNKYINKNSKYCPICGQSKLKKGKGFMKYTSNIEIDENKKAKICPKCGNEEIKEGNYCSICGLYLINKCTNYEEDTFGNVISECDNVCEANARYCDKCGNKTLFFREGLLPSYTKYLLPLENEIQKKWKEEINNLKQEGKVLLYTNLLHTELIEIDSSTIAINFIYNIPVFFKTIISKEENLEKLQKMINRIFPSQKSVKIYNQYEDINLPQDDDLPF